MSRKKMVVANLDISDVLKEHATPKVVNRIKFKTKNQKRFYKAIEKQDSNIIMAHALAGAGKTYISIQKGLEMLLNKGSHIEKLIIINPTVDVGGEDKLGHLPGDLMEKMEVHNESSLYILNKIIGEFETKKLIEKGAIEFKVLNFLRGINIENSYMSYKFSLKVEENDFIIFPSILKHMIEKINSDDLRITIVTDVTLKENN